MPRDLQALAEKQFELLKADPWHPSLRFEKKAVNVWSVRVNRNYRALGVRSGDSVRWFWIGDHDAYERELKQ